MHPVPDRLLGGQHPCILGAEECALAPYSADRARLLDGRKFWWSAQSGLMAKDFHVDKLADEFGQYKLYLKCESCSHERRTTPHLLANQSATEPYAMKVKQRTQSSRCQ